MVVAMVFAAYGMRIGGYWLIGHFHIGPRLQRMLNALPGAVIAASVLPIVVKGGFSALCAVAAAVVTMMIVRSNFAAVVAGIAAAALVRAAGF
jgi:branched chain amino acid efflux pump